MHTPSSRRFPQSGLGRISLRGSLGAYINKLDSTMHRSGEQSWEEGSCWAKKNPCKFECYVRYVRGSEHDGYLSAYATTFVDAGILKGLQSLAPPQVEALLLYGTAMCKECSVMHPLRWIGRCA